VSEGQRSERKEGQQGQQRSNLQLRRQVVGLVVSDKMTKTVVVRVNRQVKHPFYKKFVLKSVRYKAHDENQVAKMGDQVSLVECRPLSRHKRWVVTKVLRKGIVDSLLVTPGSEKA
jgi:small subunit ribosomal protein S17